MATENLRKFDPNRTIQLRGFDRHGANAAIHSAAAGGFTCPGVFRSADDFAVILLWDADNLFEHYTYRYLPDFDHEDVVLRFDVDYNDQLSADRLSEVPDDPLGLAELYP